MQRLVFEFQKTCDNNLSFEAFQHKIENQIKTFERQKMTLDSLLGFENTKRIQEKKKREELKQKKDDMDRKKKEDLERKQRKEERLKKKKEEEKKKKEEADQKNEQNKVPIQAIQNSEKDANDKEVGKVEKDKEIGKVEKDKESNDLKNIKEGNKSNVDGKIESSDTVSKINDSKDEDKLDISEGNVGILGDDKKEIKPKAEEGVVTAIDEEKKKKREEINVGEAIMKNEHYAVFSKFNKIAGEELLVVPETFLPEEQMKLQRQKAMNNVLDLDDEYIEYLTSEVHSVRNTFDHFKKLLSCLQNLESVVKEIEKTGDYLVVSEESILSFIKDYLLANQIAEEFLKSNEEYVRQTPFFEDLITKMMKYMETLTNLLRKRFEAFTDIQENSLTINYSFLKATMTKFASLNLAAILSDIYSDLNKKILHFMLGKHSAALLFETVDEKAEVKTYRRQDDDIDDVHTITLTSTPENIKEYMSVLQNNAQKYYNVLIDISKVIPSTPIESKLEELQDFLENRMENVMRTCPLQFIRQNVLDIMQKFDEQMNSLNDTFVFDMKGMAENIESMTLVEKLKVNLLSLKNSMHSQMSTLKESQDKEDYNVLEELVVYHFLNLSKLTQQVLEKKKGASNKRNCLEVILLNYQLLTSLLDLFEHDLDKKTHAHYTSLISILAAVKQHFLQFIDLEPVHSDEQLFSSTLKTLTDLSFLECQLVDSSLCFPSS